MEIKYISYEFKNNNNYSANSETSIGTIGTIFPTLPSNFKFICLRLDNIVKSVHPVVAIYPGTDNVKISSPVYIKFSATITGPHVIFSIVYQ